MAKQVNITFVSQSNNFVQELQRHLPKLSRFRFSFYVGDAKGLLPNHDVIVSPANSFGELRGGIDNLFYEELGREDLQQEIYSKIQKEHYGELLVGHSMSVVIDHRILLMCPTMDVPKDVRNTRNAYYFTRAMLSGLPKSARNVLCPIPCVGVGCMDSSSTAKQMSQVFMAFEGKGDIYDIYKSRHVLRTARETIS